MIPVVCIVGKSGAGKTTLIEALVSGLKGRGYRVGTIKHDVHGFEIDREGKDTWRHKKAGADLVLISSPVKMALIKDTGRDVPLEELVERFVSDVDLVLVEGYKAGNAFPKVEVYRASLSPGLLCTGEDNLIAVVGDAVPGPEVPRFSWGDAAGVLDLIEKSLLSPSTR